MKKKSLTKYLALLTTSVFSLTYFFLCTVSSNQVYAQDVNTTTSRLYIPISRNTQLIKNDKTDSALLIRDYLSSTRTLIQSKSTEVQEYTSFGQTRGKANTLSDRQFGGHRSLSEPDIYHAGARFYNQNFGQFIQPDKLQGGNRYAFSSNNPIMIVDSTGNFGENAAIPCPDWWCGSAAEDSLWDNVVGPVYGWISGADTYQEETDYGGYDDQKTALQFAAKLDALTGGMGRLAAVLNGDSKTDDVLSSSLSRTDAASFLGMGMIVGAFSPADEAAKARRFTTNLMAPDSTPYQVGFMRKVLAWHDNRGIDPGLIIDPNISPLVPVSKKIADYRTFKERFIAARGEPELGVSYFGLFARPEGKNKLRISPQSPGLVKHGMLVGAQPTDLAGEFGFKWSLETRPGGDVHKIFEIFGVNLDSGGYRPRNYQDKLDEATRLLKEQIYTGL